MRLFAGVELPAEVRRALAAVSERLRPTAKLGWIPAENLHITIKFIGEWQAEKLDDLKAALERLPSRIPIDIEIKGLGWFPNPHNPRVFWAGVHASPGLAELARQTDAVLKPLGVPEEDRPFSPHLTLARIKNAVPLLPLRSAVANLPSVEFGRFTADRFCLFQSELRPEGSKYTKLEQFPLLKPR